MQSTLPSRVLGKLSAQRLRLRKDYGPLIANALMHLVNDGCFVAFYPLLPLIAVEFNLSYAQVGLLKTSLSTSSTLFQLPVAILAERWGEITFLALGMGWVAIGFLCMGLAGSFIQVLVLTFCAGSGGSVQHPVASSFVSRAYEGHNRIGALGVLNFAGDLGKFAVPAVFAFTLTLAGWRQNLAGLGMVALVFSVVFWYSLRHHDQRMRAARQTAAPTARGWGILYPTTFVSLLSIGVLDAMVRNTLLTFVPFLLMEKGLTETSASLMLTVIFAGGAAGKLGCGLLANRLGPTRMIVLTEVLTGLLVLVLLPLGQFGLLPVLFCLGFMLNGTSSILLDGVADIFDSSKRSRGYGLYFTIYLGAGAVGPIAYGLLGDAAGLHSVFVAMGVMALAIVPLTGVYHLSQSRHAKVRV